MGAISSRAASYAKTFIDLNGLEGVERELGKPLDSADTYDFQTLKDVLGLSDTAIQMIKRSGKLPMNLTDEQKLSLAGEALLKKNGASWDGQYWSGGTITLTDRNLEGGLYGWVGSDGTYEFRTAEVEILRNPLSLFAFTEMLQSPPLRPSATGRVQDSYKGLDSIVVTQRDLEGNVTSRRQYDNVMSVQTMLPEDPLTEKQIYGHDRFIGIPYLTLLDQSSGLHNFGMVNVGPETLREGDVAYKIMEAGNNPQINGITSGDTYLQAVMGSLYAPGYTVHPDGNANYAEGRHLQHPAEKYGNSGCVVFGPANWSDRETVVYRLYDLSSEYA